MLDVSELLFPDTRQLTALQEFLVDGVDELDTRWSCHQILALAADVVAFEEGFDNANGNDGGNAGDGHGNGAKKEVVEERTLPSFVKGASGDHQPTLTEKWTTPPKYYTEATLLRAMAREIFLI